MNDCYQVIAPEVTEDQPITSLFPFEDRLYFSTKHDVYMMDDGVVEHIAGNGRSRPPVKHLFDHISSVCVSKDGRVIVADIGRGLIVSLNSKNARPLAGGQTPPVGGQDVISPRLDRPRTIAPAAHGRIYVRCSGSRPILAIDSDRKTWYIGPPHDPSDTFSIDNTSGCDGWIGVYRGSIVLNFIGNDRMQVTAMKSDKCRFVKLCFKKSELLSCAVSESGWFYYATANGIFRIPITYFTDWSVDEKKKEHPLPTLVFGSLEGKVLRRVVKPCSRTIQNENEKFFYTGASCMAICPIHETIYFYDGVSAYVYYNFIEVSPPSKYPSDEIGTFQCNGALLEEMDKGLYALATNPNIANLISDKQMEVVQKMMDIVVYGIDHEPEEKGLEYIDWLIVLDYCDVPKHTFIRSFALWVTADNCAEVFDTIDSFVSTHQVGDLLLSAREYSLKKTAWFLKNDGSMAENAIVHKHIMSILRYIAVPSAPEFEWKEDRIDIEISFKNLFNNPEKSDIVISIDGDKYHCHRVILSSKSRYFAAMFKNNSFAESSENEYVVDTSTHSAVYHRAIIEYCYGILGEMYDLLDAELVQCSSFYLADELTASLCGFFAIRGYPNDFCHLYNKVSERLDDKIFDAALTELLRDPDNFPIDQVDDQLKNRLVIHLAKMK